MIRECNDDLILSTSAFRALSPTQPPVDVFEQITPKRKERRAANAALTYVLTIDAEATDAVDPKDECCMNSCHGSTIVRVYLCALGTWRKNITPCWIAVIRKGYRARVRERNEPGSLGEGDPRIYYEREIHLRCRPFPRAGSSRCYAGELERILFKRCVRIHRARTCTTLRWALSTERLPSSTNTRATL